MEFLIKNKIGLSINKPIVEYQHTTIFLLPKTRGGFIILLV